MDFGEKFPLTCLLIDPSRDDYKQFVDNIGNHKEISHYLKISTKWFKDIRIAYQWIRQQSKADIKDIDFVFIDPAGLGGIKNLPKAIDFLRSVGISNEQVIALPDSADAEATWDALKASLGTAQVFNKQDCLSEGSWPQLINAIEELAAKRKTYGGGQAVQFFLMRVEAKVETLEEKVQLLRRATCGDDFNRRLEGAETAIDILRNTIYQGPGTQGPALIQQVVDMTRLVASLERETGKLDEDIGNAVEVLNNRMDKMEEMILRLIDELDNQLQAVRAEQAKADTELRLQRADYIYGTAQKIALLILAATVALTIAALTGVNVLELIINALFS